MPIPDLAAQDNPGEISPRRIDRLHAMVDRDAARPRALSRAGSANTAPRPRIPRSTGGRTSRSTLEEVRRRLPSGVPLLRNPASRFSFIRAGRGRGARCSSTASASTAPARPRAFAEQICAQDRIVVGPDTARIGRRRSS